MRRHDSVEIHGSVNCGTTYIWSSTIFRGNRILSLESIIHYVPLMQLYILYLGVASCYLMSVNTIVWHYLVHNDVVAKTMYGLVLIIGEIYTGQKG
jgi:hypothetical protein